MRAGSLRDKIILLSSGENDWGEPVDPQPVATIAAQILKQSGSNKSTAGAERQTLTVEAKIRYRKTLIGDESFRWFDNVYEISHIERDPKRRWMILTGESEQ